ncbi:hypothetical protein [Bradyrhizobium liaoningense]
MNLGARHVDTAATGYGERAPLPEQLASAPVVQKPYTLEVVENALGKLQQAGVR